MPEDERDEIVTKTYTPTQEEQDLLDSVEEDWIDAYEQKVRSYRTLRYSSLDEFWERSRDHYNGFVAPIDDDDIEQAWKSRAFKKKTRHKVIATVAQFIDAGIGLDFSAVNDKLQIDREMSRVIDDVFEWSLEREAWDMKQMQMFMEQAIAGTVHIYEEIAWDEREVKEILDIDFETGKIKWEKKDRVDFKGCRAEIVPNEEMYPGDSWTNNVQDQPFIVRRKITTYDNAEKSLDKFDNWEFVEPGQHRFLPIGIDDQETERDSTSTNDDAVEIIYYFRKRDDLMAIVANGILLTEVDYPIPYPHKEYPFAKGIFEPFADSRFYWGDSLPNKNYDDQEMVNSLWRMFEDSTALKSKPPLITDVPELVDTDLLVPGVSVGYDGDFKVETIPQITQGVSQTEWNMLSKAEEQMDENSVPAIASGQQGVRTQTATEIDALVTSSDRLKGFNQQYVSGLLIEHARLRIPNLLWFLTNDDEYKQIVIDDVKTQSSGKSGRRKITFVKASEIPKVADLFAIEEHLDKKGTPVDFIFVDKDAVNDYRFHVSLSAVPKPRKSSSQKLLRQIQKYRFYATNPIIDQQANTRRLVEAMGDDPEEMMAKPQQAAPGGGQPGATTPLPAQGAEDSAAAGLTPGAVSEIPA